MHAFKIQTALAAGFSVALFVEQFGCSALHINVTDPNGPVIPGQGRQIDSFQDLKPDAQPGKRADMLMAGTHIPVELSVKSSGPDFEVVLHAHDATFETEQYKTSPTSFSLSEAAGDSYFPALELLHFPMRLGDQWKWHGRVISGGIQRQANATITSSSTTLYQNGVTTEAVKVDVDLSLYSEGDKTPAARKLIFEFVPGKGIVRREFGGRLGTATLLGISKMASVFPVPGYVTENRRSLAKVDWYLILATLILIVVGLMSLYSKCYATNLPYFHKQVLYLGIGLVPFGVFATVHPKFWQRCSGLLYATSVSLLFLVLVHGRHAKGAGRWIQIGPLDFQPSEMAKLLTVITLATFYAYRQDRIQKPSTFFYGLLHALIPTLLIFKQPHLGGAMVMLCMWLAVSLVAGIPIRSIGLALVVAFSFMGLGLLAPSTGLIKPYQLARLQALLGIDHDTKGGNYQTDRAEIAFGVGGVYGTGFLHGEQKADGYIPEQWNDFAFTIVGEEGGLIGATLVLIAYGFFFYRVWLTIVQSTEPYFKMLAAGILAVLGFHTIVNMAMILQLFPVVGIWLPFVSSGGSAIWLCMASVGLLVGIRRRERPILF